jgi:hypothetical protein
LSQDQDPDERVWTIAPVEKVLVELGGAILFFPANTTGDLSW